MPEAFSDLGLTFALAYGVVRAAHIALFVLASRDDPALRRSVTGLAISTGIGVGLITGASFLDGAAQGGLWVLALLLDYGGPFFFGAEGWKLVPGHFAERHGLIVIIALGESIVAIGVGAGGDVTAGVVVAAGLGIALAATLWWAYFDVVVYDASRRLAAAAPGRARNDLARDAYSYLHFPMVAGIVLAALGLKTTLAHVDDPLDPVPAFALVGGLAVYLLAQVAFKARSLRSFSPQRFVVAAALLVLLPAASRLTALATLAVATALLGGLIAYEVVRYADVRDRIRHQPAG